MEADVTAPGAVQDLQLVITTVPEADVGERLVRQLVDERLIACGNLLPGVVSVFRWEGAVRSESEVLVLMKTRASLQEDVFRRVAELHPYQVPELVALPVQVGLEAYCRWVVGETTEVNA